MRQPRLRAKGIQKVFHSFLIPMLRGYYVKVLYPILDIRVVKYFLRVMHVLAASFFLKKLVFHLEKHSHPGNRNDSFWKYIGKNVNTEPETFFDFADVRSYSMFQFFYLTKRGWKISIINAIYFIDPILEFLTNVLPCKQNLQLFNGLCSGEKLTLPKSPTLQKLT